MRRQLAVAVARAPRASARNVSRTDLLQRVDGAAAAMPSLSARAREPRAVLQTRRGLAIDAEATTAATAAAAGAVGSAKPVNLDKDGNEIEESEFPEAVGRMSPTMRIVECLREKGHMTREELYQALLRDNYVRSRTHMKKILRNLVTRNRIDAVPGFGPEFVYRVSNAPQLPRPRTVAAKMGAAAGSGSPQTNTAAPASSAAASASSVAAAAQAAKSGAQP
jgi:hypothetical protein